MTYNARKVTIHLTVLPRRADQPEPVEGVNPHVVLAIRSSALPARARVVEFVDQNGQLLGRNINLANALQGRTR